MSNKTDFSKIFGHYEAAPWMKNIGGAIKKSSKVLLIIFLSLIGCALLFGAGFGIYKFVQSKIPVELRINAQCFPPSIYENPKASLYISFSGSGANLEEANEEIKEGIYIKPAIEGKWSWQGDVAILFLPAESWNIGTNYEVFFGKELFAKHVKVEENSVKFSTPDFEANIENAEFTIDDVDPSKKYITFNINANYPIDSTNLEEKITFTPVMNNPSNGTLEKKKYKATVGFNENHTTAFVASEVLGVPATDVKIDISVANGIKSTLGGKALSAMKTTVLVPGMSNFVKINSSALSLVKNEKEEYEQVLILTSTAKCSAADIAKNLSVYVLPKDKPAEPGMKAVQNCRWTSYGPANVTENVLKNSTKLAFTEILSENDYEKQQSFKIKANPSDYIYIKLEEGAKFYGGYFLPKTFEAIKQMPQYPSEVTIMSEGDLISMQGSHQIPVLTRGISKIRFSVWRMKSDEINHIVSQSNGDIKNFRFSNDWRFNQENVSELYKSERKIVSNGLEKPTYTSFDFSQYLSTISGKNLKHGLFLFRVEDADSSYKQDTRLIMVTDQALIVKRGTDGNQEIFVQSISSGKPVANSRIQIVALNGNVLSYGNTDSSGHVTLPKPNTNTSKGLTPVAITATLENDFSFMPFNAGSRMLDYSNFNTGGEYGATDQDIIHAYIFSDRGIYRPGDEVRVGMIVKSGNWNTNLTGLPLVYVVTDPNGTEIAEKDISLNKDGFEEIKFSTKNYSPTGFYSISVFRKKKVNGRETREFINSESVKVEEFLPDTLSITTAFDPLPSSGWINSGSLNGTVKLKNLFGTNAEGNTVKAEIRLVPGYVSVPQFKNYRFSDPFLGKDSYTEILEETKTDSEGRASFALDIGKFAKASYRLTFTADGYEKESGRNVTSSSSVFVSPLEYLIGVKADGDLSYIKRGTERTLNFIAVGSDLMPKEVDDVELSLTENRYVSVLVREPNGVYKYQSVKKQFPVETKKISIPKTGLTYKIPSSADGDFVITLKNKDGIEFNHTDFSIIGEQNLSRSLSKTAELELKAEKTDYKQGETARIFIKAPYAGSGLITIERDKVYSYKWFSSDGSSSLQSIQIPLDIEGNGYINVLYTRDYNSEEIYMNPFCYASLPFSVDMENRKNTIELSVMPEAKPDTDFKITYSSAKKAKIALIAVDEGILQVAKYSTPNPLSFFFKKRALEVTTSQLLDLILPEFNILKKIGAAGGGEDYDMLSHNLNPFKRKQNEPVAFWSGIIDSDETARTVTYHIPSYFNGKLRVMAVAVNSDSIGVAETSSEIKDTYIIVPNAPLFASPNDTFEVPVTVTNNEKGTGNDATVVLSAKTNGGLLLSSENKVELKIPEGKDATTTFTVTAGEKLGNADIIFTAEGKNNSSKMTSSLSIRPAVPYQVSVTSGVIKKGENKKDTIDVSKKLYDEYAERTVNLSYLPLGLAKGLEFYLEKYVYGCSEQQTSVAFPYLFPDLLAESNKTKKDAQEAIDNVVSILASRQKTDGSIGYWTYKSFSFPELDAYCALFLTEAKERGYYVPESFFNRLLDALKNTASTSENVYASAFSIFVLTRNELVTTSYIERLQKILEKEDKINLSGMFLAGTYKMLQMDSEGKKILSKIKKQIVQETPESFYNYLYYNSMYLYILSKFYPEQLPSLAPSLLENIETELKYKRFTSISSAAALLAIESYLKAVPTASTGKFTVTQEFEKNNQKELLVTGKKIFSGNYEKEANNIVLQNTEKTDLFYQVVHGGFLKPESIKDEKSGIEVYREFTDSSGKKITSAKLGDTVYVKVNFRSISGKPIDNVAIVDLLPSGLEADIDSVRQIPTTDNRGKSNIDYIDVREDRIIFYGTLDSSITSVQYKTNAITQGTFAVPPIFAEAMYNSEIRSFRTQGSFTVKK